MLTIVIGALLLVLLGAALSSGLRRRTVTPPARAAAASVPGDGVEMIDPRKLLFSLPTIHDGLPPVEPGGAGAAAGGGGGLLREDDWRQEEFVAAANAEYVARTLGEIRSHRAVHAAGPGFRDVFVRGEPPVPLAAAGITVDDVARALGTPERGALYFMRDGLPRVAGGFSLVFPDGGFVYGHAQPGGVVTALGLGLVGGEPERHVPAPVARLAARFDLLFVDWVRDAVVSPGDEDGLRAWVERVLAAQSESDA